MQSSLKTVQRKFTFVCTQFFLFKMWIRRLDWLPIHSNKSLLYADDLKLYTSLENQDLHSLQTSIIIIHKWSAVWQLLINHTKSQHLHLQFCCYLSQVCHGWRHYTTVDTLTDCGIVTNSDLSYTNHVASVVSKALSRVVIIHRSFYSHNIVLLWRAFITVVFPIF